MSFRFDDSSHPHTLFLLLSAGAAYTLRLQHFPARRPLAVQLLAADGRSVATVGMFGSRPSVANAVQEWKWTVGWRLPSGALDWKGGAEWVLMVVGSCERPNHIIHTHTAGAYYLEVADAAAAAGGAVDPGAVAFTQAFEVLASGV